MLHVIPVNVIPPSAAARISSSVVVFVPQLCCVSRRAPNPRVQRTPRRVVRDRAFFSARFCYNVTAIYWQRRR